MLASWARSTGDLGYETYFRLMAVPLVLFAVGAFAFWRFWHPQDPRARWGFTVVVGALVLVAAGTVLEFWGELLSERPTVHDAFGADAFWGSRVGWGMFVLGFFGLLVGGATAAVRLWRSTPYPRWIALLVALLGFGVLFGNLFSAEPPYATVPFFGAFGAGWIALGVWLWRRPS